MKESFNQIISYEQYREEIRATYYIKFQSELMINSSRRLRKPSPPHSLHHRATVITYTSTMAFTKPKTPHVSMVGNESKCI